MGLKGPWSRAQKLGPVVNDYLKYECWGPGESIDTHIVGFCEKIENFEFGAKGPLDQKFGPGVQITLKMVAGLQASP